MFKKAVMTLSLLVLQVWSEQPGGHGATNFITGAGAFLQNIIFGFGGFRLHAEYLCFEPSLPSGVQTLHFVDIDFLGSSFDFVVSAKETIITLRRQSASAPKLLVYIFEPEAVHSIDLNRSTKLRSGKGLLMPADSELPPNDSL